MTPSAPALGPRYSDRYAEVSLEARSAATSINALARRIARVASPGLGATITADARRDIQAMRRELDRLELELP